eukprot:TRINITY_DN2585_c0_g1_i2.p1 TRINITY_DN2585_c0_g1~~TRINITY_DN2585_c0_g1_i2.p1  ORF type:complete len:670 (-),score=259.63 TRINITY_DN2585_c0_g1_i2:13-2022(-)
MSSFSKTIAASKNKFLLTGKTKTDDSSFEETKSRFERVTEQQQQIYKHIAKQHDAIKNIQAPVANIVDAFRPIVGDTSAFTSYAAAVPEVERAIGEYSTNMQEKLNAMNTYFGNVNSIKSQIKERTNLLMESDLAANEVTSLQKKGDATKVEIAQSKADTKKNVYEAYHAKLYADLLQLLDNKAEYFDGWALKALEYQRHVFACLANSFGGSVSTTPSSTYVAASSYASQHQAISLSKPSSVSTSFPVPPSQVSPRSSTSFPVPPPSGYSAPPSQISPRSSTSYPVPPPSNYSAPSHHFPVPPPSNYSAPAPEPNNPFEEPVDPFAEPPAKPQPAPARRLTLPPVPSAPSQISPRSSDNPSQTSPRRLPPQPGLAINTSAAASAGAPPQVSPRRLPGVPPATSPRGDAQPRTNANGFPVPPPSSYSSNNFPVPPPSNYSAPLPTPPPSYQHSAPNYHSPPPPVNNNPPPLPGLPHNNNSPTTTYHNNLPSLPVHNTMPNSYNSSAHAGGVPSLPSKPSGYGAPSYGAPAPTHTGYGAPSYGAPAPASGGYGAPSYGAHAGAGASYGGGAVQDHANRMAQDVAVNVATNREYQQKAGNAMAGAASNKDNQAKVGATIASNSDSRIVKGLAGNSTVQGFGGKAMASAATNEKVQQSAGNALADQAKTTKFF